MNKKNILIGFLLISVGVILLTGVFLIKNSARQYTQVKVGKFSVPVPTNYSESKDKEVSENARYSYKDYEIEIRTEPLGFTKSTAKAFLDSYEKLAQAQQKLIEKRVKEVNEINNENFSIKTSYVRPNNGMELVIISQSAEKYPKEPERNMFQIKLYVAKEGSLITYVITSKKKLSFTNQDFQYIYEHIILQAKPEDLFAELPFSFPMEDNTIEEIYTRERIESEYLRPELEDPFVGNDHLVLYFNTNTSVAFTVFDSTDEAKVKSLVNNASYKEIATITENTNSGVPENYLFSYEVRSKYKDLINDFNIYIAKKVGNKTVVISYTIVGVSKPEEEYIKDFNNFLNTITWKE